VKNFEAHVAANTGRTFKVHCLLHELGTLRDLASEPDAATAVYLKDGETPAECIARNRADADATLTLLAQARAQVASLAAQVETLTQALTELLEATCERDLIEFESSTEADRFYAALERGWAIALAAPSVSAAPTPEENP